MQIKKQHPIRSLLVPIVFVILGLSAYDYYDDQEITWYEELIPAVNDAFRELRSMIRNEDVAPFVYERSQPSDERRVSRAATEVRTAVTIDSRFMDTGEPRFELVGRVA